VLAELARSRGLIVITGPQAPETTTLASVVDQVNQRQHEHIVTIEDPIEYVFDHKNCVVNRGRSGATHKEFRKRSQGAF
jgi:twitching motility protein PilT